MVNGGNGPLQVGGVLEDFCWVSGESQAIDEAGCSGLRSVSVQWTTQADCPAASLHQRGHISAPAAEGGDIVRAVKTRRFAEETLYGAAALQLHRADAKR